MEFETEQLELDVCADTNDAWRQILSKKLGSASRFEIHCWKEETNEIQQALQFGTVKACSWEYGTIIEGRVTTEFVEYLLSLPKPTDTEIYNKMTPFFSIFLDNGFSSEHYGTELNQVKYSCS